MYVRVRGQSRRSQTRGIAVVMITVLPLSADSVEKLDGWIVMIAASSRLARGGLVGMPPYTQMMVFVG